MYQNRYTSRTLEIARKRRAQKKKTAIIASLALVGLLAVGGTVAWLFDKSDTLTNTFTPAVVESQVTEVFENNVKSNVAVKNDSNIPVYVRATLVVNWVDEKGAIAATAPVEGDDYSLVLTTDQGWDTNTADGYYYYTQPVAAGGSTGSLVDDDGLKPLSNKEGYTLKVDVVASVIQALPTNAVVESWGVTLAADGETISK